ncbi:MAG TPA: nucleotidyltransferase family protein [Actinomycetota bacterium]|nr:nucleotidyltransferase family protein [Actinomycetota bacterium]
MAITEHLSRICIPATATLREALEAIDRGGLEIALVTDDLARLVGVVTDGDARRAILAGASLQDPAERLMQKRFTAVGTNATRAEVLDLMRARSFEQIPILDAMGRLAGIHLLQEIIGAVSRPNWALILAGGRGERLRPLTDFVPKPMIKVAGRPILERLVLHLVGFGIRRVFLAVNYKAEMIEGHFGDGSDFGCHIEYLREEKPLGTGGALGLLPAVPVDPLLVLNGDLVTQLDVGQMLAFHADGGYKATVGVHEYVHTVPFGVLELQEGSIVAVREKPTESWPTNAGIYVLDPELLARVPQATYFSLPELVEECIDRNEAVGAFQVEEDWIDVGRHQELQRARGETENP